MKPKTEATSFGSITVGGKTYEHDILIRLDGTIKKRKKKLSRRVYGTSHTLSLDEAEYIFEEGTETLLIGSGQYDNVRLSPQAQTFFEQKGTRVVSAATPEAIRRWNELDGPVAALFHVTC